MSFDYYDRHTTREERLAYLDGWGLIRARIKPQFDHKGWVWLTGKARKARGSLAQLSIAFEAGKDDACR